MLLTPLRPPRLIPYALVDPVTDVSKTHAPMIISSKGVPQMTMLAHFPRLIAAVLALLTSVPVASAQFGDPFGDPFGDGDEPTVTIEVLTDSKAVAPGGQFVVAVVLDHAPTWHSHLNQPIVPPEMEGFIPIATTVEVASDGAAVTPGPIQWPEPHAVMVAFTGTPVEYLVYEGRAIAFIPMLVSPDALPGETVSLSLEIGYQACDDASCLPPELLTREIEVPVVAAESTVAIESPDFTDFDPSVFAQAWDDSGSNTASVSSPSGGSNFFGIAIPGFDEPAGLAILALLAAAGGFILNLTPCVLPVIPIKIMTISQHASSPGKSLFLGLWMFAGVVGFWIALGVLASTFSAYADPSRLFGIWWITLGIGVLILVMGVGIMGAFNINLPDKVYMVNPKADSASGSFMFGIMTAVLGLPCFGFVAGALLAGSAAMPWWTVLTIFAALGLGMGLPYLVLAAKPSWVKKIPRTGPASELVKQVMGLLLLAAGAYFAGSGVLVLLKSDPQRLVGLPWYAKTIHWWFVGFFGAAAGVWLVWQTVKITKSGSRRAAFGIIGLIIAAGGALASVDQTIKARDDLWLPFSESELTSALESDRVVVLDFTADWCLNCKALESGVLLAQPVKGLLLADDVVPLKADLTSTKAEGWDKLRDLGRTGIPTLVVFTPGGHEPWIASAYTSDQVVAAIEAARAAGGS